MQKHIEKKLYSTKEFMAITRLTNPNQVSELVKEGIIRPLKRPNNLRFNWFTENDLTKAARYLKNHGRVPFAEPTKKVSSEIETVSSLLDANKTLLTELETLKEKINRLLTALE